MQVRWTMGDPLAHSALGNSTVSVVFGLILLSTTLTLSPFASCHLSSAPPYSMDTMLPQTQVFIHGPHDQSGALLLTKMESKLSDLIGNAFQNRTPDSTQTAINKINVFWHIFLEALLTSLFNEEYYVANVCWGFSPCHKPRPLYTPYMTSPVQLYMVVLWSKEAAKALKRCGMYATWHVC